MKKLLLSLFAALTCGFTAQAQNLEDLISGAYEGQLYISLFQEVNEETEAINFSKIDLSKSTLEKCSNFALYNFGFNGLNLGNIELKDLGLSEDGDKIVFAEKDPVDVSFPAYGINATAAINAGKSYIKGDSAVVYVDVIWVDMDAPIYVLFKGRKLAAAENVVSNISGKLFVDGTEVNAAQVVSFAEATLGTCSYDLTFNGLTIAGKDLGNFAFTSTTIGYIDNSLVIGNSSQIITADEEWTLKLNSAACTWIDNVLTLEFEVYDESETLLHSVKFVGTANTPVNSIESITAAAPKAKGVYTIAGVYVGTSTENLPAGLYIVDGVKTVVK